MIERIKPTPRLPITSSSGYQDIQLERNDGRANGKTDSPIKVIESLPDSASSAEIWGEVETMLWFRRSYLNFPHSFPDPIDAINIARLSVAGHYDNEIAEEASVSRNTVARIRKIVERILYLLPESAGILSQHHKPMIKETPQEERLVQIHRRFQILPSIVREEIENKSELGLLLKTNPHLVYILDYLSTGRSVLDLMEDFGIEKISKAASYKISEAIVDLFLSGERTTLTILHKLSRCVAFGQFIRHDSNWQGIEAYKMVNKAALRVIQTPPRGTLNRHYFAPLGILIKLLPILELAYMIREHCGDDDILEIFPEVKRNTTGYDPYSIDPIEYFEKYQRDAIIPESLKIMARAYLKGKVQEEVIDALVNIGLPYKRNVLETYIGYGFRFLENIIFLHQRVIERKSLEAELSRNRRGELRRITDLISTRIKELNKET